MLKTITQGGQVHIHQLRMLKQVFFFGILFSFLAGTGFFIWTCSSIPSPLWSATFEISKAKILLATNFTEKGAFQLYTPPVRGQKPYRRACQSILHDPFLQTQHQVLKSELKKAALKGFGTTTLFFILLMFFWLQRGRIYCKIRYQRGAQLVSSRSLKRQIKQNKEASDLKIGTLPLLKNKETSHLLMTGTTGSGKTTLFHTLLPQIRERKDKAIIVDITGDFFSRYYDDAHDILLNPFDTQSLLWNPWADCQAVSHYDILAQAFLQPKERGTGDPFWDNASRAVFKAALKKFADLNHPDVEDLYQFLVRSSDSEFCTFFKDTDAASLISLNNEKTTTSIRSVLSSQIESLGYLRTVDGPAFSIREWVRSQERGWLFITASPDQRKTLTPLISAWVDIAINALMMLSQDPSRRLWVVLDELTALQKLPSLPLGLAEARKYGGCFLTGFQSKPQLEVIYGEKAARAMLDLFNTKVFFRCTEPSTQLWISRILGDKEEDEPHSTLSYGAHSTRDGVSLSHQKRHTPLVMPSELGELKDLEAYIKFPGAYPCGKINIAQHTFPFVPPK